MSAESSAPTWRNLVAASAAAGAIGLGMLADAGQGQATQAAESNAIRPFRINISEAELVDLRRRVAATRWPDKETVTDQSQHLS